MEAAGIAPASQNPQDIVPQASCVDAPPPCLHIACNDLALRELVASWHGLAVDVREGIVRMARVRADISRAGE
jgi:hypothetical protein